MVISLHVEGPPKRRQLNRPRISCTVDAKIIRPDGWMMIPVTKASRMTFPVRILNNIEDFSVSNKWLPPCIFLLHDADHFAIGGLLYCWASKTVLDAQQPELSHGWARAKHICYLFVPDLCALIIWVKISQRKVKNCVHATLRHQRNSTARRLPTVCM